MKLIIGGKQVDYTITTLANDSRVTLRLAGIKAEEDIEAKAAR